MLEGDERTGAGELRSSGEILTRLTRNHMYEGPAYFSRMFETDAETLANRRLFLDVERSRMLTMKCNGVPVPAHVKGTVSTPYAFELTGLVKPGENDVTLCCDNSYPGWPHDAIVYSSAATDETQTNWNGLLGRLQLRLERADFISALRVYPDGDKLNVVIELDCTKGFYGSIVISGDALEQSAEINVNVQAGRHEVRADGLNCARTWFTGTRGGRAVHADRARRGLDEYSVRFGVRVRRHGRAVGDKRRPFSCAARPTAAKSLETGHMPMTVAEWKQVLFYLFVIRR